MELTCLNIPEESLQNLDTLQHTSVMFNIAIAMSYAAFGRGTGAIYLDNVGCTGTESTLLSCSHRGIGVLRSCSHYEDAGVVCWPCKLLYVLTF